MPLRIAIACSLLALTWTLPAHAAKVKAPPSPCTFAEDPSQCETKAKAFNDDMPKANRGDYLAQREVAFCYSSGCHGAISVDAIKACTWQTVIVGTEKSDYSDVFNYRRQCEQLNAADRQIARNDAFELFSKIYKKQMTKTLPYEGTK